MDEEIEGCFRRAEANLDRAEEILDKLEREQATNG